MMTGKRILVLIDGFNFYHRLREYQYKYEKCVKWLNYRSLIESYFREGEVKNCKVIYFSAIAEHRGISSNNRHDTYIKALESVNIDVVLGQFKTKHIRRCAKNEQCKCCNSAQDNSKLTRHEEKNTDVNIAITLIEYTIMDQFDKCYVFSSDNDFTSAIKRAKELRPDKKIVICPPPFPDEKSNKHIYFVKDLVTKSGERPLFINWEKIKQHQFPDNFSSLKNPWQISQEIEV
jgi:uncharacterized LabA/DUF88 family protein